MGRKSWNNVAALTCGLDILELTPSLPGGTEDEQSRYVEAEVNGIIAGCLYLPNGNPAPAPSTIINCGGLSDSRQVRRLCWHLVSR